MANIITQSIEQISKEKNIDPKVIIDALEDAMVAASRKFYKTDEEISAASIRRAGQSRYSRSSVWLKRSRIQSRSVPR